MNKTWLSFFAQRITRYIERWAPALVIMILVYSFSDMPSQSVPRFEGIDTLIKKGAHFIGYALLNLAYLRGLGVKVNRSGLFALALSLLYALSDEYHQSFVPGRNSRMMDVGIDMMGAIFSLYSYRHWPQLRTWVHFPGKDRPQL